MISYLMTRNPLIPTPPNPDNPKPHQRHTIVTHIAHSAQMTHTHTHPTRCTTTHTHTQPTRCTTTHTNTHTHTMRARSGRQDYTILYNTPIHVQHTMVKMRELRRASSAEGDERETYEFETSSR